MTESVPKPLSARRLTEAQYAEMQRKLDEVRDSVMAAATMLRDVQAVLTPCYGEKDGEYCYLPDRHVGRHMSDRGVEWLDTE